MSCRRVCTRVSSGGLYVDPKALVPRSNKPRKRNQSISDLKSRQGARRHDATEGFCVARVAGSGSCCPQYAQFAHVGATGFSHCGRAGCSAKCRSADRMGILPFQTCPQPGTRLRQRVAENEVQDHPDRMRNEDRQQRPHYVPHLPPLRIPVDVSDQRNPSRPSDRKNPGKPAALVPSAGSVAVSGYLWVQRRRTTITVRHESASPATIHAAVGITRNSCVKRLIPASFRRARPTASITAATPPASHSEGGERGKTDSTYG